MNFNDISNGNPTKKVQKSINMKMPVSTLGERFLQISHPFENDSQHTKKELMQIVEKTNQSEFSEQDLKNLEQYRKIDLNILAPYIDLFKAKKIKLNTQELKDINTKIKPFIISLKYYYNRPRPHILAGYYNIPIYPDESKSLLTPSYPSSHTIRSLFLSAHLSATHVKLKTEILDITRTIIESRETLGFSYKSDITCAVRIFKYIDNAIGIEEFMNGLK